MRNLIEKVRQFIEENTRLSVCLCGILILMAALALVFSPFTGRISDGEKKDAAGDGKFVPDQEILAPLPQSWEDEYQVSREASQKWSEEEARQWFREPDAGDAESLGRANDAIIEKIIGAAP